MPNNPIDLEHLTKLAMMEIPDERMKSFTEDLCAIVQMAENLPALEDAVENLPGEAETITLREDTVLPSLPREALLQNAHRTKEDFFVAPNPME